MVKPTLLDYTRSNALFTQEYERYLPTAFDESLTLIEKVNKMIIYLNQIGKLSSDVLEEWNKVMDWVLNEGLESAVFEQLLKWLEDGTLGETLEKIIGEISKLPFVNLQSYIEKNKVSQTKGFQDCLDFAKLTGNGVHIVIPPNYDIVTTAELVVYPNTKITVGKGTTIKRDHDGYILTNGIRDEQYSGYEGFGNITIEGGIWDINGVTRSAIASGISFGHARNLVFRDMILLDSNSHHIEVNSSENVLFEDITCLGFSATSDNPTSEALQLDHATVYSPFGKKDGTHCKNVVFRRCRFGSSGSTGTVPCARGIGSHSALIGVWHENILIENCLFEGCTDYNIQAYNWKKVRIINNDFNGGRGAIIIYVPYKATDQFDSNNNPVTTWQDVEDFTFSNNTVRNVTSSNSIRVYGTVNAKVRNVRVTNNTFKDIINGAGGVYATYFDSLEVASNNFENLNDTVVSVSYGNGLIVIGNTSKNTVGGNGVTVSTDVNNVVISDNYFEDIDEHGFLISANIKDVVINGNIIKNVNRTNLSSSFIRLVSGVTKASLVGNVLVAGTAPLGNSLYATNTNSEIVRCANVIRGAGAVYDPASVMTVYGDIV